jgi:hypothetical protein
MSQERAWPVCRFVEEAITHFEGGGAGADPGPTLHFLLRSGSTVSGFALGVSVDGVVKLARAADIQRTTVYLVSGEIAAWATCAIN